MQSEQFESLRKEYPRYISANQLYKICRISKRSAAYLLQNKIIPCKDSGKKTRRYRIKLDDVIRYLQKRDAIGTMIPPGALNSNPNKLRRHRECFADLIPAGESDALINYFKHLSQSYPDVLNARDVTALTGLSWPTIRRFLQEGAIQSIPIGRGLFFPKQFVLEFVRSHHYISVSSDSESFHFILGGFQEWLNAK